jgi:hypothetical protein
MRMTATTGAANRISVFIAILFPTGRAAPVGRQRY